MLNYLWGGMFLAGIIYGAFAGTLPQITEGLLSGAKEAVELCLSVAGIVAFWTGLMTVAKETGFLRSSGSDAAVFAVDDARAEEPGDSTGGSVCQSGCKHTGTWLGGYSCRSYSDGRAG